jgi:hypothetical protein
MRHSVLTIVLSVVGSACLQPAAAEQPAPAQVPASQYAAKDTPPLAPAGVTTSASPSAPAVSDTAPAVLAAATPSDRKVAPPAGAASFPSSAITDAQIKKYRSKGYKPQIHDGRTVFCHSEANLGSRLEHQVCRTAEQLEEDSQQGQDMARDIQHGGSISVRSSP